MDNHTEYVISRLSGGAGLDEVAALEAASFTSPWSRDRLARDLRNVDVARVYVLRNPAGELLAFCGCWLVVDELHINTLAVKATARRRVAHPVLRFGSRSVMAGPPAQPRVGAQQAALSVYASARNPRSGPSILQPSKRLGAVGENWYLDSDRNLKRSLIRGNLPLC